MTTVAIRRLPPGALWAVLFLVLIHIVTAHILFPRPVAREALRHKVMALTTESRPTCVIAGDSRALNGVIPAVVARRLALPLDQCVNIAVSACEPSGVRAIWEEFHHRFGREAILVISVSPFAMNDGATSRDTLAHETLWSLSLGQRLRLVPVTQGLAASFLPGRACYHRVRSRWREWPDYSHENGFLGQPPNSASYWSPRMYEIQTQAYLDQYLTNPQLDGIRRRLLERDLAKLDQLGAQVVVLDGPMHPVFLDRIAGTAADETLVEFHQRLARICTHLGVPVLRYEARGFAGEAADELFADLFHLSRPGAERLSLLIANDLDRLIEQGRLRLPRYRTLRDEPHDLP